MDQSAQATTDIKRALNETVKLDDGRSGYIFTELPPIGLLSRWHCHICGRTISSERSLVMHLTHPVHTSNLRAVCHPAANFKKFVTKSSSVKKSSENVGPGWTNTDVVPGEPVPPGMEDTIETCHIQAAFDAYKGPLIGLEYIVELVNLEDKSEPRYICLLCEKRGDPRSVMVHVTSQNHLFKYICCFFRSVGNLLNLTQVTPANKKGYGIAIRKVAAEIEKAYGRLKPTSAAAETFAQKKHEILKAIDEKEHFRETPSTTFLHLVTPEKLIEYNEMEEEDWLKPITKPLEDLKQPSLLNFLDKKDHSWNKDRPRDLGRQNGGNKPKVDPEVVVIDDEPSDRRSLSSVSSVDSMGRSKKPGRKSSRSRSRERSRQRRDRSYDRRRRRSRSRSRDRYRDSRRSREDRRRYEPSPDRRRMEYDDRRRDYSEDRRWDPEDRYRRDERRRRTRSPVRRPLDQKSMQNDIRKKKWDDYRRKLTELEISMEDKLKYYEERPEKHPLYNEEWKSFWNKRYKEVQQEGRDPNNFDFKPEWIVFWGQRVKQIHSEELRLKSEELRLQMDVDAGSVRALSSDLIDISPPSSDDGKEVTVQDIRNTWKGLTGTDLSGPSSSSLGGPHLRKKSPSPHEEQPQARISGRGDVVPPTVHCLRLFTVLEHLLGSLAPRVFELLSKALILERESIGNSMCLLKEPEVHVFLETVTEKIRALLITGVVDRHLVSAARSVVSATQKMLRQHPPKSMIKVDTLFAPSVTHTAPQPLPPAPSYNTPITGTVALPGMGFVDQMAVAQQIASALVTQGRTDVSEQELEELINAVVGIARASNATFNTSTSSTSFFSQLNMATSTAGARINDILNSMIKDATGKSAPEPEKKDPVVVAPAKQFPLDEELKEKLVKFNMLAREEQQSLIVLLKDLEKTEPKRVENLRKYVSVGLSKTKEELESETREAQKEKAPEPTTDTKEEVKKPLDTVSSQYKSDDDDDDDYSFEDVYKAASAKLKKAEAVTDPAVAGRATPKESAPEVRPSSALASDPGAVFGPQRNPAEPKPVSNSPFSFNPKNSAPDVSDPNSQMSLDEADRTPANTNVNTPTLQTDRPSGMNFNDQTSRQGYGGVGYGQFDQRSSGSFGDPTGFNFGFPSHGGNSKAHAPVQAMNNASTPFGFGDHGSNSQDAWYGGAPTPGSFGGGYFGPRGPSGNPFQPGNNYQSDSGNQGYAGNYSNPGGYHPQGNNDNWMARPNSNYANSSNQYQNWNY